MKKYIKNAAGYDNYQDLSLQPSDNSEVINNEIEIKFHHDFIEYYDDEIFFRNTKFTDWVDPDYECVVASADIVEEMAYSAIYDEIKSRPEGIYVVDGLVSYPYQIWGSSSEDCDFSENWLNRYLDIQLDIQYFADFEDMETM